MQNKQRFQRASFVSLKGQPNTMTITKIIRTVNDDKSITFAYECSYFNEKKGCFHREVFEEDTLEKVRGKPKT